MSSAYSSNPWWSLWYLWNFHQQRLAPSRKTTCQRYRPTRSSFEKFDIPSFVQTPTQPDPPDTSPMESIQFPERDCNLSTSSNRGSNSHWSNGYSLLLHQPSHESQHYHHNSQVSSSNASQQSVLSRATRELEGSARSRTSSHCNNAHSNGRPDAPNDHHLLTYPTMTHLHQQTQQESPEISIIVTHLHANYIQQIAILKAHMNPLLIPLPTSNNFSSTLCITNMISKPTLSATRKLWNTSLKPLKTMLVPPSPCFKNNHILLTSS